MWTDRQLKLLQAGGNDKLIDFCDRYDLKALDIKTKFTTRALQWYRKRNEAQALDREFTEPEPTYEQGRCLLDGTSLDKKTDPTPQPDAD